MTQAVILPDNFPTRKKVSHTGLEQRDGKKTTNVKYILGELSL